MKAVSIVLTILMVASFSLTKCTAKLFPNGIDPSTVESIASELSGETDPTSVTPSVPEEVRTYTIPDVKGMPYDKARSLIEDGIKEAGMTNVYVNFFWDPSNYDPAMNAKITYIKPAPGTVLIDDGTTIVIELAAGEQAPFSN